MSARLRKPFLRNFSTINLFGSGFLFIFAAQINAFTMGNIKIVRGVFETKLELEHASEPPTLPDRVYINAEQYFDGVPESAWQFYIGGYQPAQKWLKDRKGMTLSFEDVKHYGRIIYVLQQTKRIMQEIDDIVMN